MSKRPAENSNGDRVPLRNGDRPLGETEDPEGPFEDEFEDEFESDEEIIEAGVDGRPDEEREAEELAGASLQTSRTLRKHTAKEHR